MLKLSEQIDRVSVGIRRILLLLFACMALMGCADGGPTQPLPNEQLAAPDPDTSNTAAADAQLTQEQAETFAQAWETAMQTDDVPAVNSLFDWDDLFQRVVGPLELPAAERGKFVQGMKGGNPAGQLTNQIAAVCQSGGSYRLVKVLRRDGRWHAVFRMMLPNQGMNYHDIRLTSSNGKVIGDRLFVAINSEEMADTMRALAQPAMQNRNLVGRLTGQQKAAAAAFDTTIALLTSIKSGQYQEAIRLYDQLPEASRANKSVMLGMITAQSQLDEAKYLAAIDRYREAFPNDPSLGLVLLDAALLRQDWDLLELSRQKLNAWTGGDPYVDLLIGTIYSQEPNKVQQALDLTKDIDPSTLGLPTAHYNKLTIALSGKDFATAVQQMKVLREEYDVEFEEESMRSEPLFAEFLESQEFRDWQSQ